MYLQFLQKYGVLMACLVIICVVLAEWYFYRTRNYYLLMVFSVNALNGMINDSVMSLSYNIFWIAAAMAVFGSRRFRGEQRKNREFRMEVRDLENLYDAAQQRGEKV
jgi:TctA family transporter